MEDRAGEDSVGEDRVGTTLTIGEVADRLGISTSALRFYERRGLIDATRSSGGHRRYEREVLRRLSFIRLAQRVGVSLEAIGEALATLPDGRTPTAEDWERLAQGWREDLDERIAVLEGLRDRLTGCIGCGCLSLDRCALYNPDDIAARLGPGPQYLLADPPRPG